MVLLTDGLTLLHAITQQHKPQAEGQLSSSYTNDVEFAVLPLAIHVEEDDGLYTFARCPRQKIVVRLLNRSGCYESGEVRAAKFQS